MFCVCFLCYCFGLFWYYVCVCSLFTRLQTLNLKANNIAKMLYFSVFRGIIKNYF